MRELDIVQPLGLARSIFQHAEVDELRLWLAETRTDAGQGYEHIHIVEDPALRARCLPLVARYLRRAHQEAATRLRDILGDPLDPRAKAMRARVLENYPVDVDNNTILGLFGEALAGLILELFSPAHLAWRVPAFSFHSHNLIYTELINRALGRKSRNIPGRVGDDCIAFVFQRNTSVISRLLICEAKCTDDHDASMILDAHSKLGAHPIEASIIWLAQIIDALRLAGGSDAAIWIEAIERFRDSQRFQEQFRRDAVSYTHSRPPVQRATWIPQTAPHAAYTIQRDLTSIEVRITEPLNLAREAYALANQ